MKKILQILCFVCLLGSQAPMQAETSGDFKETLVAPTRIVWMSDSTGKQIKNAQNLLAPFNGQISVSDPAYTMLTSSHGNNAAILLDFGRELQGGIKISSSIRDRKETIRLRVRLGESVTEAMSDVNAPGNPQNATNEHSLRDFVIEVPWLGTVKVGNSGFRFARIDLLDENVEYPLRNVSAFSVIRDLPYLGSFTSSDNRLDSIWRTGAYTVHLNMQEYLWDGIKRDRLVWLGDMHPELMTVNSVFGANATVYNSLDFAKNDTPLPGWINGMSSYSLWWIIIQNDLYLYEGNKEYLKEQQPYLLGLLKQIAACIDKNGVERLNGTRFLDWPTSENNDIIHSGLQSLTLMALKSAKQIGEYLDDTEIQRLASDYLKLVGKVKIPTYGNSQASALQVISGMSKNPKNDCKTILDNGVEAFSTFYGYYMLEALAQEGKYAEAMDIISKYWGAMLDLGATTFWEDLSYSDIKNAARIDEIVPAGKHDIHSDGGAYCYKGLRLSLCHGWASGPTSWLSKHVLGVTPVEPGCKTIEICPHLGNLTDVSGTFPTPQGIVTITHHKDAKGKIESKVDAPSGVTVILKK